MNISDDNFARAAGAVSAQTKAAGAPLVGLRVVDLTQFLSGPYCTQMLADLGAEIIKVESPQGDLSRIIPPNFVGKDSVYYVSINRNKRSIAVDMKLPGGVDLVRKLILASDIVVENFRPGVLNRLGIKESELRGQRQGLIWCSIPGFGQTGPYRPGSPVRLMPPDNACTIIRPRTVVVRA
jgi:CoA:oxalate CoA-transferase